MKKPNPSPKYGEFCRDFWRNKTHRVSGGFEFFRVRVGYPTHHYLISFLLLFGSSSIHGIVGGGGRGGAFRISKFKFPAKTAAGPEAEIALTEEVNLEEGVGEGPKNIRKGEKGNVEYVIV